MNLFVKILSVLALISFGSIFFFLPLLGKAHGIPIEILIDKSTESIQFTIGEGVQSKNLNSKFGDFKEIYINKYRKSSNSENSRNYYFVYTISLVKNDGALFWLDSFYSEHDIHSKMQILLSYINLPVLDPQKIGIQNPNPSSYSSTSTYVPSATYSPFLHVQDSSGSLKIEIKKPTFSIERFFMSIISFLFIGVPIGVIIAAIDSGETIFMALSIPFLLLFASIATVMLLMSARSYQLTVDSFHVGVKYNFPLFFNSFLSKEIKIPSSDIQFVQVHRVESGNFWLTLKLRTSQEFEKQGFLFYFFNAGIGNASSGTSNTESEDLKQTIGLWLLPYWTENDAPSFSELYYIEKLVQDKIGLRE